MTRLLPVLRAGLAAVACLATASASLAALPIQKWQQASGATVYLVESHAIPMVDVQIDVDGGGRRDPAAQAGLASLTASMTGKGVLAAGNEPALDENQLGEAWADLGAGFGGDAGSDRMSFSLRSLTDPALLERAVHLAARQIGEPSFPSDVWLRDRQRIAASIREANTRPGTVAGRAYRQAVYGGHPYGYETTEATLAAIEVDDMRRFHRAHVLPCRAKASVVGNVTRAQADAIVAELLSRLPQGTGACPVLPPVADVPPLAAPAAIAVPFQSAQAHVLFGQPGFRRSDPDFFPLLVGNYILGGSGLVSRLSDEVREKRGLSYGASSSFSPGLHAGAFTVGLQTRPDQAAQATQVARETVARFVAEGPSAAELKAAKDNLVGGFALRIDSNRKLLDNVASIAWNELPLDYLDTWTAQVERVTAEQVRAAMARKLQPERMVTITVGATPPAVR
ncbi:MULTISPECIES: M16 family metallopeptidase [Ramlibacter]|jgi:zinc protease|uniref:Insulinase family protein n=1 Tax=Ramlibacter pinisoli TaxID=2682844 RepID=A0A6N8IT41_9BURK|nr:MULTISPECIES: pitrilysin family protein [Ramlibacter]MBA2965069.1 insulinase family protein [Ramlibacter sp. CGMCC 1.13660]MVQ30034.1 insulinase family protein [Ramlibacter pinisoli]